MRWSLLLLAACGDHSPQQPTPPPPPPAAPAFDRDDLLAGKLPEGPEADLINAQCRICHSIEYLTQQRLGEPGWKKTIDKMRKFGAMLDDAQAATIVSFAARNWNTDLPDRWPQSVDPPAGALP